MTWLSLAATGLAFFVALLLHKWLFKLFVAENYSTASYLLPWVILAGGLFSAGQILALKLMSEMRPESMTVVKVTTASLVIFSFVYCIWMAWLARHSAVLDALQVESPHLD